MSWNGGSSSEGSMKKHLFITEKHSLPVGDHKIRLLVLRPLERHPHPVPGVLWVHGGGYQSGTAEEIFGTRALSLVVKFGAVLIAPNYRLSRHHPYPAALQDCYTALLWLKEHAEELGVRSDQIMVGGESAGGGMAAALCMLARDRGEVNIATRRLQRITTPRTGIQNATGRPGSATCAVPTGLILSRFMRPRRAARIIADCRRVTRMSGISSRFTARRWTMSGICRRLGWTPMWTCIRTGSTPMTSFSRQKEWSGRRLHASRSISTSPWSTTLPRRTPARKTAPKTEKETSVLQRADVSFYLQAREENRMKRRLPAAVSGSLKTDPGSCPDKSLPGLSAVPPALSCNRAKTPESEHCRGFCLQF